VLQKTGSVSAVRTAAGIIELPHGNVAVCVLTSENKDRRWTASNAGEVLTANIGKIVLEHFEPNFQPDAKSLALKVGSQGPRVEQLQRALNEQLKPSPEIQVDGEFGPITRAAVVQWQKSKQLKETGEIDAAGWKLLGLESAGGK
jgi:D-alanyl-D-alanine carboxypeptidase (penicillin-binding protein 5/6)